MFWCLCMYVRPFKPSCCNLIIIVLLNEGSSVLKKPKEYQDLNCVDVHDRKIASTLMPLEFTLLNLNLSLPRLIFTSFAPGT